MMKHVAPLAAAFALTGFFGCEEPPTYDEPPLFQAYDPLVSCPADKVGWDLSTGGGLEPLERSPVGDAIKVRSSSLANCGLLETEVRTACDGRGLCRKDVTCDDGSVDYVCGTETAVYKARVDSTSGTRGITLSCGSPITIVKALYAPTAIAPADISLQLSARCSGKRRCAGGPSGYELNGYADPAPNQSKLVRVTYLCGTETTNRTIDVDDFRLDFFCPDPAPRPMREPMKVQFANPRLKYGSPVLTASNASYAAQLLTQISAACEGKNECEVTFTGKFADGTTPPYWKPNDPNAGWYTSEPDELGWLVVWRSPAGWLNIGANYLIVGYTCGAGTFVEKRAIDPMAAAPNNTLRLKCGESLTVTGVDSKTDGGTFVADPALTSIVKTRCDGHRACTPPAYVGTLGPGRYKSADGGYASLGPAQTYKFTCGSETTVRTAVVDNSASVNLAQVECPAPAMDLTAPGIRLVSVSPADRTLEVSRQCTGRDQCAVPSGVTAQYRCVDSPSVKTSDATGKLSCGLAIFIKTVSPGCYAPPPPDWCGTAVGSCNFVATQLPSVQGCPARPTVTYTCGCDPTVRTVTGERAGEARLDCPALSQATACSKKGCVPKYCYGAQKRDVNLQCVDDSTLVPTFFNAEPVIVEWRALGDGGTDLTPPAAASRPATAAAQLIKSDYPYQPFTFLALQTDGNREISRKAHALLWAYDEFIPRSGAKNVDGGTLPSFSDGFRCVVSETGLDGAPRFGSESIVAGGTGQTFHPRCFDQDRLNDPGTSTFDAAMRVGLTDGQFRDRYTRSGSYVTVSLDPHGVATVPKRRTYNGYDVNWVSKAVNPVGFFYDPKRDYLSLFDYYSQTWGEAASFPVQWVASTQIELAVTDMNVAYGDLLVDVEDENALPEFDVDMRWFLRGDSPANPYSLKTRVANNPANTSLADRNLSMTVEMARIDPSLNNLWAPSNSVRFPAKALSGGNNFLQTDRAHVAITPALRKRLLTVRKTATSVSPTATPDGFMANILDADTAFLVRTCIDFDGASRAIEAAIAPEGTSLPSLNGYSVKVSKRCSEPRTVVFRRQLYVRPTIPATQDEKPADRGAVQPQGDRDVGGPQSNGVELGCIRQCMVSADCGEGGVCTPGANGALGTCNKTPDNQRCRDTSVSQGGMGGQFPISLYEVRTQATVERSFVQRAASNNTNTCTQTRGSVLTFTVSAPAAECTASPDGPVKSHFQTSFSPNIQGIIDLVKAIRSRTPPGGIKPDASKANNVRKAFGGKIKAWSKDRKKGKQEPAEGVAVGISKEFFITIGPVPISIEISATASLGFKFELERDTEQAKVGMTTEFYPCVNASNTSCYSAENTEATFDDALTACNEKGGSLALVRTAAMNTAFTNALNTQSGVYWIGAQSQYVYEYPPCADGGVFIDGGTGPNGAFSQGCKDASGTGYVWLRGGSIASQLGLAPAILSGSNQNNTFTNVSLPASFVPDKAALTYSPGARQVSADRVTARHRYACGYDSATEVYTSKFEKKFNIEFGIGVGAAICLPSSRIGVCAVVDFKIFEASWSIGSSNQETNVYRGTGNARYRQSVFGENGNFGTWERKALEGSFSVELRFFFFSESFKVKEFGLVRGERNYPWNGDIFPPATTPYFDRKVGE